MTLALRQVVLVSGDGLISEFVNGQWLVRDCHLSFTTLTLTSYDECRFVFAL
jgi:hypothetical protein